MLDKQGEWVYEGLYIKGGKSMTLSQLTKEMAPLIRKLPFTEKTEEFMTWYFLKWAVKNYNSMITLGYWVYGTVPLFFQYLSEEIYDGKNLTLKDIGNVRPRDVEIFIEDRMGLEKYSRLTFISKLKVLYNLLEENEYIEKNRLRGLRYKTKKSGKKSEPIFKNDLDLFFGTHIEHSTITDVGYKYDLFCRFLLQTAMRPGHALLIKTSDFKEENRVVSVYPALSGIWYEIPAYDIVSEIKERTAKAEITTKNVGEAVYVSEDLVYMLRKLLGKNSPILNVGYDSFRRYINRWKKWAITNKISYNNQEPLKEFKFTPYSFRKTWASTVYAITGSTESLKSGGWEEGATPLKHYTRSLDAVPAFQLAQKYKIYLEPGWDRSVEYAQSMLEPRTQTPAARIEPTRMDSDILRELEELREFKKNIMVAMKEK